MMRNGEGWEEGTTRLGNKMSRDKQMDGEKMSVENIIDESKKSETAEMTSRGRKGRWGRCRGKIKWKKKAAPPALVKLLINNTFLLQSETDPYELFTVLSRFDRHSGPFSSSCPLQAQDQKNLPLHLYST